MTSKFSEFIRNAAPEEKEKVYSKVLKESSIMQEEKICQASNQMPKLSIGALRKNQAC